jgi:hypothetical protein
MNRTILFTIIAVVLIGAILAPTSANAFDFGGRIVEADYTLCCITGTTYCVVPGVNMTILGTTASARVLYIPYISKIYKYYQLRSGPEALGTYFPVFALFSNCSNNIVLKMGTSLF